MDIEKQVTNALGASIDEVNEQLPDDRQIAKDNNTPLFGENGVLDSLGLVNLIVCAELKIQEQFDVAITIADEKAMSMKNSPFRTIESLSNYIVLLIQETAQ
jgi:D-alanine--poly(phosphoribitol) ligase subunit 2